MDSNEQLRSWAIEQVVKHHGGTGVTMEMIIAQATRLIEFVRPTKEKESIS